ncbi:MAG: bifunctional phosphoribosylaminoimidazolecarboxamide formyltransferase/IMP cyclohydrolase [Acidobacteriota bacterium]
MKLKIRRALISVYEKEGIAELARGLHALGVEILSTGGTARMLADKGIPVTRLSEYTGLPEMLDGRVKTLHPKIHAGILALRTKKKHLADIKKLGAKPIDLVVVNLYPFEKTASMEGIGQDELLEMIDIGGPTMVRAAAKNFRHAVVVVDHNDYPSILEALRERGDIPIEKKWELAIKAFQHTASYDAAIYSYLSKLDHTGKLSEKAAASAFPEKLILQYLKVQDLRYGENPHQKGAFYREKMEKVPTVAGARQLQGKELSFNNIMDFDAALSLVAEFTEPACCIIKHTNPCGTATGKNTLIAYRKALETDPISAFGGVIAFNREVDKTTALAIAPNFVEGIIAPSFSDEAVNALSAKKNLRLLEAGDLKSYRKIGLDMRKINGGLLLQEWDFITEDVRKAKVVTKRKPTSKEMKALAFAWKVIKHVKSNAIVFTREDQTVSVGAGQMSRVDSVKLCIKKACIPTRGAVMASDAFFPFRDGIDQAARAGITAVIQPGGSIRDEEVIKAADQKKIAMLFTGVRHFKH